MDGDDALELPAHCWSISIHGCSKAIFAGVGQYPSMLQIWPCIIAWLCEDNSAEALALPANCTLS